MRQRLSIFWIEVRHSLERLRRPCKIPRSLLCDSQQISRTALRRLQFHRFAQWRKRRLGVRAQQQNPQIQLRLGHFRVQRNAPLVFRSRFRRTLQRCIRIRKLEMRVCHIGLLGKEFL